MREVTAAERTWCWLDKAAVCFLLVFILSRFFISALLAWRRGYFTWCGTHTHSLGYRRFWVANLSSLTLLVIELLEEARIPRKKPKQTPHRIIPAGLKPTTFLLCRFVSSSTNRFLFPVEPTGNWNSRQPSRGSKKAFSSVLLLHSDGCIADQLGLSLC